MAQYINANTVSMSNACFNNNQTITSVDCRNLPWQSNSMRQAFYNCTNLQLVTNINKNVTDMYITFDSCSNLVNAPAIPNSVTNMSQTFLNCTSLVNAPVIPNSVTTISYVFAGCTNLVNAPVIPNSVTNMFGTFSTCTNLTGDINIYSNGITSAIGCFFSTLKTKNVYIPLKYTNGVNTLTYNSFTTAGYSTTTRKDGVLLFDTGTH